MFYVSVKTSKPNNPQITQSFLWAFNGKTLDSDYMQRHVILRLKNANTILVGFLKSSEIYPSSQVGRLSRAESGTRGYNSLHTVFHFFKVH